MAELCVRCGLSQAGGCGYCSACASQSDTEVKKGLDEIEAYLALWLQFGRWLAGRGVDRI